MSGNDLICPFYRVFVNPLGQFLRFLAQTQLISELLPNICPVPVLLPSLFAICWLQLIFYIL